MIELSLANVATWAVQVAALSAAGVCLPSLLKVRDPRARLIHYRVLLAVCVLLPLLQPWMPRDAAPAGSAGAASIWRAAPELEPGSSEKAGAATPSSPRSPFAWLASRGWSVEAVVATAYAAGVAARLAWLGIGLLSLVRLRRLALPLDPRPEPVETAVRLVGFDAEFRVSPRVVRPVTFGLRGPVVLVPPGFAGFEPVQQTAVAAHELLHVARRDWARTVADEVLLSVLWFHPALWWLVDQIRLSTEQLVDLDVVRLVRARKPYLEALLKLAAVGPTPMLRPASLFLKHGHLAQRVALLVREVPMSRVRLVSSFAVVMALLAAGGWFVVQALPLSASPEAAVLPLAPSPSPAVQAPPPPPPPPPPAPAAKSKQSAPTVDAALTVTKPGTAAVSDKAIAELKARTASEPDNPEVHYTLATYYWDRAFNGKGLTDGQKASFVAAGLSAVDRALQLKPDYINALIYKNLLLRSKATLQTDPDARRDLVLQADKLRDQAIKLRETQDAWDAVPKNALKIGGAIAPPTKVKHVAPVYPPEAKAAGVSGVVVVETVIGPDGKVLDTRVLRSVPKLDAAAIDAVKQWEFTPTLLNGAAVPVVATMTVNFVLDGKPGKSGVPGGAGSAAPLPPPPPPPPPPPGHEPLDPAAVRIGGGVMPPTKILDVLPVYPPAAREARIQGVVILEALIDGKGKVEQARVLRSVSELDQAALDAVKQWVFTPTLINGKPVKVVMTVTVNFKLQ